MLAMIFQCSTCSNYPERLYFHIITADWRNVNAGLAFSSAGSYVCLLWHGGVILKAMIIKCYPPTEHNMKNELNGNTKCSVIYDVFLTHK